MGEKESHEHMEAVKRRAYAIWLEEGGAHGRDREHWRRAEEEVRQTRRHDEAPAAEVKNGAAPILNAVNKAKPGGASKERSGALQPDKRAASATRRK